MQDNAERPVSVATFLGTFGVGLTTVASVISDVLSPLAPVSLYLGLLALALLVAGLFCSRSQRLNAWFETHLPGLWFRPVLAAFGIATVGLFTTYYLSDGHREAGGFLADSVPVIARIQRDLGMIAENTARIARSGEAIEGHTRDISRKLENVKREVSDNPRKELANLGIDWKPEAFLEAVSIGDLGTLQLFLDGGMPVLGARSQGRPLPVMLAKNTANPGAVLDLLVAAGLDVDHVYASNSTLGPADYTILGWAIEKNNQVLLKSLASHGGDLDRPIGAFGTYGTSYQSSALGLSIERGYFDMTQLLLELGADIAVGNYNAYRTALARQSRLVDAAQKQALERLIARLEPPRGIRDTLQLEQRLVEVDRELTDVAMKGLRAVTSHKRAEYDTRYDELQVERRKLQQQLGMETE